MDKFCVGTLRNMSIGHKKVKLTLSGPRNEKFLPFSSTPSY